MNHPHTYCSRCGTRFEETPFPRTCSFCKATTWLNPIPVAVGVIPVVETEAEITRFNKRRRSDSALVVKDNTGLLTVRRNIEPDIGELAMPSGFVEVTNPMETWQEALVREVQEETGLRFRGEMVEHLETVSHKHLILIFGQLPAITRAAIEDLNFEPNEETQELVVIQDVSQLVWDAHQRIAAKYVLWES